MDNYLRKAVYTVFFSVIILVGCKKNDSTLEIEKEIIKQDPVVIWDKPNDIYFETQLTDLQLNAESVISGLFYYTPPKGTYLRKGNNQTLQVIFVPDDKIHYNNIIYNVTINVLEKMVPVITWSKPEPFYYGTALTELQLNATSDVDGKFEYEPALGEVIYIGKNINLTLKFIPNDLEKYVIVKDTTHIDVSFDKVLFNLDKDYGIMTDQEGNTYKTITIGNQTWMAENLRTTKYRNGDNIPIIESKEDWILTTSGAYCWMGNDEETYKDLLGALYNWYAVTDTRGIAPIGWHVPSMEEWNTLISFLGGIDIAGNKLRERSTSHWRVSESEGTNESGFTALPCGSRDAGGSYGDVTHFAHFWSRDNYYGSNIDARFYRLYNTGLLEDCYRNSNSNGKSVRLVKDSQ